jgi:acetyltransferase EpsM
VSFSEYIVVGYSGHAFVICDAILESGFGTIMGYLDIKESTTNPYNLKYLGTEADFVDKVNKNDTLFVLGIGDNLIRTKVSDFLLSHGCLIGTIIHPAAWVSKTAEISSGVFVNATAAINSRANIDSDVIVNTGAIVEHDCTIGRGCHIAPGAVLAGNVMVGSGTFIGANAVVKQGIKIGNNVIIGAGSVIISDIPDNVKVVGNPARMIC